MNTTDTPRTLKPFKTGASQCIFAEFMRYALQTFLKKERLVFTQVMTHTEAYPRKTEEGGYDQYVTIQTLFTDFEGESAPSMCPMFSAKVRLVAESKDAPWLPASIAGQVIAHPAAREYAVDLSKMEGGDQLLQYWKVLVQRSPQGKLGHQEE